MTEEIEVEVHTFTIDMILAYPMTRKQVADHLQDAIDSITTENMIYWINHYKKKGIQCDNKKYFHIAEETYNFEDKTLCKECIEEAIK